MSCEKSFLKGERHVFSQMAGGGGGESGGEVDGSSDVDTVAAPAQSNTQAAANSLSRKGRTTCGNRPRGEVIGMGVGEAPQKGQRAKGGACQQP